MLPEFHFILPVWGQAYVEMFLKVTLPCQLSPDNLGSFKPMFGKHKYKIFTMAEHVAAIQNSESYKTLSSLIETEIRTFDDLVDKSKIKYEIMSVCHGVGFKEARDENGNVYVVTLVSDSLVSNGSFRRFYELALEGKKAIVIGNFRVDSSRTPELIEKYFSESGPSILVSSRELMELAIKNIHPDSNNYCWNSSGFNYSWPAYLYWNAGKEGLILRGIHLHPIVICATRRDAVFDFSEGLAIDGSDFIGKAVQDPDDVYISADSDEIAIPTLDDAGSFCAECPPASESVKIMKVALWMKRYGCSYAVKYLNTKIRLHYADMSPQWEDAERESDKVVGAIIGCLEFLNGLPGEILTDLEDTLSRIQGPIKPNRRNNEDVFKDMDKMLRAGEELVGKGQIAEAYHIFSNILDKLDKVRGVAINNLAVVHAQEGRLKTAEYLLRYLQKEGHHDDSFAANLEIIRGLIEKENSEGVKYE